VIRPATRADVPVLVELIEDLATYEWARDEVEIDEAMLAHALFGEEPSAFARIATVGDVVAGMALYYRSYSTWTGLPGIYLEDLYVRPEHRGSGLGKALLASLARTVVDEGYGRLEWSVLDWNEPAIDFYRSIGATATDEWTRYRLAGSALKEFASFDGRPVAPPSDKGVAGAPDPAIGAEHADSADSLRRRTGSQ
jgi:ribosomal protein S18 acetylase RimI-like enzyme